MPYSLIYDFSMYPTRLPKAVAVLALDVRDPYAGDLFPGIFNVDPHACPMILRSAGKIKTVVAGQDAQNSNLY